MSGSGSLLLKNGWKWVVFLERWMGVCDGGWEHSLVKPKCKKSGGGGGGGGEGGAYGPFPKSRARHEHVSCFPRFILLGSFSGTLLVQS